MGRHAFLPTRCLPELLQIRFKSFSVASGDGGEEEDEEVKKRREKQRRRDRMRDRAMDR